MSKEKKEKLLSIANETTCSSFLYSVSPELYDIVVSMSEEDLSYVMPNQPSNRVDVSAEGKEYRLVLEEIAKAHGLKKNKSKVKLIDVPTVWFDSGWTASSQKVPHLNTILPQAPVIVDLSGIRFEVDDSENDVAHKITQMFPEGFQIWGFGFMSVCDDEDLERFDKQIVFSIARTLSDDGNVDDEHDTFYVYAPMGSSKFQRVRQGIGAASVEHGYSWNEDVTYTLPGMLLAQR